MVIEISEDLELKLKEKATAHGLSPVVFACEVLEREVAPVTEPEGTLPPFTSGYGMWEKYGIAPISAQEIDENRADMFKNFGEDF